MKQILQENEINPFEYIQVVSHNTTEEVFNGDKVFVRKKWRLWSPFHYAVHYNSFEVVQLFLTDEYFAPMLDSIVLKRPPGSNKELLNLTMRSDFNT